MLFSDDRHVILSFKFSYLHLLHQFLKTRRKHKSSNYFIFIILYTFWYGTPGLSYHGKTKFVMCLYKFLLCFNRYAGSLYHYVYNYVVCGVLLQKCDVHYGMCIWYYEMFFSIIWCAFITMWCNIIIMVCTFLIMWFRQMCFKTSLCAWFLTRCSFFSITSFTNIFIFCTDFFMWCANFIMMMIKVTYMTIINLKL